MKKVFLILVFVLFIISDAYAHGGRTDSCGGHRDRKRGGYHIHNYSKYCNCYPDAKICNKDENEQKENDSVDKPKEDETKNNLKR